MARTIKGLAMDGVEAAASGHPGMPMGCATMASVLFARHLVHDPKRPDWVDRDRFVLSAGHGSMLLYATLHLSGYDLPLSELRNFRQWGSRTPGHPEVGHTPGVEVTTGPLGTGFATGVGLALAERLLAARFGGDDFAIVDHNTYGIVSDGDLMEGVAGEAASLAGHLGLGKLIYLYDQNRITIDGSTDLSFTEDVKARFEAYGWQVLEADGHDPEAVDRALVAARAETERPSLICCRTVIAHGSPNKAGTSASHGAPLGAAEVKLAKEALGIPLEPTFFVPSELTDALSALTPALEAERLAWEERFAAFSRAEPARAELFLSLQRGELPEGTLAALPKFEVGSSVATRKVSAKIIAALAAKHETLVGGSADLAGSNGAVIPDGGTVSRTNPLGRNLHFGVREHAMSAISNGLALHGGLVPFDATFLVFSDFMRGGLRLSALMGLPVIHLFSHDSFWLGEDGPTHQPIEHTMSLRAIPGLHVVRPADANETVGAWRHALVRQSGPDRGPTAILLTRQDLPVLPGTTTDVSRGAYVVWEPAGGSGDQPLDGVLLATGSEVSLAVEAAEALLGAHGRRVRVVSMPCWEAFAAQDRTYRDEVLPPRLTRRLSVEAGTTLGWDRYASAQQGIDHFGASAPAEVLAERFGFVTPAIVARYLALP